MALIFISDQWTKHYIFAHIMPQENTIILSPFLNLTLTWNQGISFGMMRSFAFGNSLFIISNIVIVGILGVWLYKAEDRLTETSLAFIIGGALGNICDRIRYGAVIDFIDFHIRNWHWYTFNIADSAICIGAVVLGYIALFKNPSTHA